MSCDTLNWRFSNAQAHALAGTTKGGFYECAAADALLKSGHSLHFYRNETKKLEVDFLLQIDGEVVPIEVKSGNKRATSLKRVMEANPRITRAYKFADANIGLDENGIVTAPLYLMGFL